MQKYYPIGQKTKTGRKERKKRARDEDGDVNMLSDVFGSDLDESDSEEQKEPTRNEPVRRSNRTKYVNTGKRRKRS